MKTRIAIKLEYEGSKFSGSQMQKGVRTAQEELEKALAVFFRTEGKREIKCTLSGRTDAGVHACGQVAHFDLSSQNWQRAFPPKESGPRALDELALMKMVWSLNGIMPPDISIVCAQKVPDKFHARFSARRRSYVYRILNRAQRSALCSKTHLFLPEPLNLELMKAAAGSLLGRHDFTAFKSSNADKSSPICLVDRSEILNKRESELEFWISADRFVYNMVRIIVGTLLEIGLGKRAPQSLAEALAGKDRHLAGPTAAPWGLCLNSVDYPAEFALFQREPVKIENSL